jgi:hypothetical protein
LLALNIRPHLIGFSFGFTSEPNHHLHFFRV